MSTRMCGWVGGWVLWGFVVVVVWEGVPLFWLFNICCFSLFCLFVFFLIVCI